MQTCLSPEAETELELFKELDRDVGIALEASTGMLAWDPNNSYDFFREPFVRAQRYGG